MRIKSERRGSNSRQPAWKAGALPTELLPHFVRANIQNNIYLKQVFLKKTSDLVTRNEYFNIIHLK